MPAPVCRSGSFPPPCRPRAAIVPPSCRRRATAAEHHATHLPAPSDQPSSLPTLPAHPAPAWPAAQELSRLRTSHHPSFRQWVPEWALCSVPSAPCSELSTRTRTHYAVPRPRLRLTTQAGLGDSAPLASCLVPLAIDCLLSDIWRTHSAAAVVALTLRSPLLSRPAPTPRSAHALVSLRQDPSPQRTHAWASHRARPAEAQHRVHRLVSPCACIAIWLRAERCPVCVERLLALERPTRPLARPGRLAECRSVSVCLSVGCGVHQQRPAHRATPPASALSALPGERDSPPRAKGESSEQCRTWHERILTVYIMSPIDGRKKRA